MDPERDTMCRAMVALMGAEDAESAAILTPYNGQVRLIRRILKEHTGELYSKVHCPFSCCIKIASLILLPTSCPRHALWKCFSVLRPCAQQCRSADFV